MSALADDWEAYGGLFDRAWHVVLGKTAADTAVAKLAGLTELRTLHLRGTQATDAGLVHLAGLAELKGLSLGNARVTDAGLACLAEIGKLVVLELRGAQVTDAGVAELERKLPGAWATRWTSPHHSPLHATPIRTGPRILACTAHRLLRGRAARRGK